MSSHHHSVIPAKAGTQKNHMALLGPRFREDDTVKKTLLLCKISLALMTLNGCTHQVASDIEYTQRMYQLHYVRPGETVEIVAKKYGMTKQELIHINQLRENHTLALGHRLHVHKRRFNEREPEITQDPPPSTRFLNNSNRHQFDIVDYEDFPGPKTNNIPRTTHTVIKRKGLGKLLLPVLAVGGCVAALRPKMALASAAGGSSEWSKGGSGTFSPTGEFTPCGDGYGGGAQADSQSTGNAKGSIQGPGVGPGPNPTYVHTSTGSTNTQGSGSAQGNTTQTNPGTFSTSASSPGTTIGAAGAGLIGGATIAHAVRKRRASSPRQDTYNTKRFRKQGTADGSTFTDGSKIDSDLTDDTSTGTGGGKGHASGQIGDSTGHASGGKHGTNIPGDASTGTGGGKGHASGQIGDSTGYASGGKHGTNIHGDASTGTGGGKGHASGQMGDSTGFASSGKQGSHLTGDASTFADGGKWSGSAPIVSRNEFLKISAPLIGAALTGGALGMIGAGASIVNTTFKKGSGAGGGISSTLMGANNTGGCGMSTCFLWPLGGDDRLSKPDPKMKGGILILNTRRERFVRSAAAGKIEKVLTPHNTGNKGLYTIVIDHSYGSCRSSFKSVYSGLVRVDDAIKAGMGVTHDFIIGEASNCCDSTISFCILDKDMPVKDTTRYLPSAGYTSVKRTQRPVTKSPRC